MLKIQTWRKKKVQIMQHRNKGCVARKVMSKDFANIVIQKSVVVFEIAYFRRVTKERHGAHCKQKKGHGHVTSSCSDNWRQSEFSHEQWLICRTDCHFFLVMHFSFMNIVKWGNKCNSALLHSKAQSGKKNIKLSPPTSSATAVKNAACCAKKERTMSEVFKSSPLSLTNSHCESHGSCC